MKEIDVFTLPVHPWAARFPMRSQDDLESMAESIKANGVRIPIMLGDGDDGKLCLIDGRNRLAACKIAGVIPPHTTLNGESVDAFIQDANLERRDLTKGQKAMLVAVRYPKQQGKKLTTSPVSGEVSRTRLGEARTVLEFCPELVDSVIDGKTGLDEALKEAQRRKQVSQASETRFEILAQTDSDLIDLVQEDRMTLNEAEAVARERREEEDRLKVAAFKTIHGIGEYVSCLNGELLKRTANICLASADDIPELKANLRLWIETLTRFEEELNVC